MKLVLKIAAGLCVGALVLTVGCAALVGAGAESVSKEMDKQEQASEANGKRTLRKLAKVENGMTQAQVLAIMGKPDDRTRMTVKGLPDTVLLSWNSYIAGKHASVMLDGGKVTTVDSMEFD